MFFVDIHISIFVYENNYINFVCTPRDLNCLLLYLSSLPHGVHSLALELEYVPTGHGSHLVAPAVLTTLPPAHGSHDALPSSPAAPPALPGWPGSNRLHPGGDGVPYTVNITDHEHELTRGLEDFEVSTEQYYLHVDAANHVLATTRFPTVNWYHSPNGPVDVPVAWTRKWGVGRVYYNALGHKANVIESGAPYEMLRRGVAWASESKTAATAAGLSFEDFQNPGKHY